MLLFSKISWVQIKTSTTIPSSPNAAALMKFGDIPVSNYSGTLNIDVPLYTIESGNITVAISLAYHAAVLS
ncbi:hypothetical protein AHMF7605_22685 [Adhaeribacter arboris]|uniref:Uncharacterized protein n=1 Tax=Adhaeribacter arboris TaxID=2072846 RepID=A0A2T2YKU5_9BACT|nr:hypothetical protein AHMF7605_22685 [Adhaeribacter arboris]